jgi:hypothetical protein
MQMKTKSGRNLWRYEKYFFLLLVILTAAPVLLHSFFPTVDGPAHLYNGNMLKYYWFFNDGFLLNFFDVNRYSNSNIADHIWFAVTGLFLSPGTSEKGLLLLYILSMAYSFRFLVKIISRDPQSATLSSYLIFPFIYSFTLRMGFFNFCLGIPVLFWATGYWIRNREALQWKKICWLTVLCTILYITHLFNFVVFGIVIACYELQYFIQERSLKQFMRKAGRAFFAFMPGLLLSLIFFISGAREEFPAKFLSVGKLTETLRDISPIITLNYDHEILYARIIAGALSILAAIAIWTFFVNRKKGDQHFRPSWIFPLLVIFILFCTFPDWIGSGGFISIRLALYFFLLLLISVAATGIRPRMLILPVIVFLTGHLLFISYHNQQTAALCEDAETMAEASKLMEEHSVLLPLNYSDNWMEINFSGYLGAKRNLINLDNYEATKNHFSLSWKKGQNVYELMPGFGNRNPPCINIEKYEKSTGHRIDYLSRYCFNGNISDSCTSLVEQEIKSKFELIYQSANQRLLLYKRKAGT